MPHCVLPTVGSGRAWPQTSCPAAGTLEFRARKTAWVRTSLSSTIAAVVAFAVALASPSVAAERCAGELQVNACAEATGFCPASAPVGLAKSDWPVFQHDVQHTGKSNVVGPNCAQPTILWSQNINAKIQGAPFLGRAAPGKYGNIYIAAGHNPVCVLEPSAGGKLWCETDQLGHDVGYGNAVIGNGNMLYVGTRDNDLWAVEKPVPESPGAIAHVAWKEKICTDGDVGTPPIIGPDGVIYFGSDSLSSGTVMAMCPGATRQVKWCENPVGGSVSEVSPALSPDASRLYVTYAGAFLVSYDAQTGQRKWTTRIETRRNQGKSLNLTPVVHPSTGVIYLGFDDGLFTVDTQIVGGSEVPVTKLLFSTVADSMRIQSPPVLDIAHDAIYFGASRGTQSRLYAVSFSGQLKWSQDLSRGAFKNNPPVVDGNGHIYVAMKTRLHAFDPAGKELWFMDSKEILASSPIIAAGRLYLGTQRGTVRAIGCAP